MSCKCLFIFVQLGHPMLTQWFWPSLFSHFSPVIMNKCSAFTYFDLSDWQLNMLHVDDKLLKV